MAFVAFAGKRPSRKKWLIRIGVALFLYTIIGFFVIPAVIKWQMLKQLPALTKRQAAVKQVLFNPYALSLTIRGFALTEPDGSVFVSFDEFYLNFQLSSILRWKWTFAEISLKKPFGQVTYREDGTFNFANLLMNLPPTPPAPPKPPPRALIFHLNVTNGVLAFDDRTRKPVFHTEFIPINVNLTNLSTIRDKHSPYLIIAKTGEGESFAWAGNVTVNPLLSTGTFRLGGLKLSKYGPYAADFAKFQIAGGTVDVAADYDYNSITSPLNLVVSNATVHLNNLELKESDTGETALSIPSLSIERTEAGVVSRSAHVGLVKSTGGFILARQNQDGSINLLSQLILPTSNVAPATNAPTPAATNGPPAIPWTATIDEIAFDDYSVKAEDKKPARTASIKIDQLAFDLKHVSNLSNAPVAASLSLRFMDTGSVAADGTATLMPPSADMQVTVSNLDLRVGQPYVEQFVKLIISGGGLDVRGHAHYGAGDAGAPLLNFTGDVTVNKFDTTDDVLLKDFLKWDVLTVDGIKLDFQPANPDLAADKLHIGQIHLKGLDTTVIRGPDERLNLQTILRKEIASAGTTAANTPAVAQAAAPSPAPAKMKLPDVSLDTFTLENASLHFADQSLEPHCSFVVESFGGTVSGISSQPGTTATVDMQGKVDARSPFHLTGKVNPLPDALYADISVAFTNTELTPFTPYTEKFAGRPLQKGKLSFAVHYLVETNAVKAENGFFVDQMTLGPKNESTNATSLPVKLAIALLKDRNGRIQLDVPVQGRIDDPKFKIGPIIWHVVVNLIEKAATSPFSLLGAAFGGGEELSYVEFAPGSDALPEGEIKKLDTLSKALFERPTVTLEITGTVDPAPDHEALARHRLEEQFMAEWLKEQSASTRSNLTLTEVKLDPKEHDRLLRHTYRKVLGNYAPTGSATSSGTNQPAAGGAVAIQKRWGTGTQAKQTEAAKLISTEKPAAPTPSAKAATAAAQARKPGAPLTPSEVEAADMEDQLVKTIPITDDDLRDLMKARADKVQAYLLQTGKVTAERLFIIAPKPVNTAAKGQSRANLSLD